MQAPLAARLAAVVLALVGAAPACVPAQPEAVAPSADERPLSRADAIARARQDAVASFGDGWIARTDAQYRGGFWMVELHDAGGAGLRYAISGRDGSIRERSTMQ